MGTLQLARALDLPFPAEVPRYFVYVALLAWAATLAGMIASLYRGGRSHLAAAAVERE